MIYFLPILTVDKDLNHQQVVHFIKSSTFSKELTKNNNNLGNLLAVPEIVEIKVEPECKWKNEVRFHTTPYTIEIDRFNLETSGFVYIVIRETYIE